MIIARTELKENEIKNYQEEELEDHRTERRTFGRSLWIKEPMISSLHRDKKLPIETLTWIFQILI